ncbi:MAG: hypothetical protein JSR80_01620 [Verrucomicrobia bacterium]|nr:hypothetical protein [Verrucomicrobiota bacterium]
MNAVVEYYIGSFFKRMTAGDKESFQTWLAYWDYEAQLEAMRQITQSDLSKLWRSVFLRG